MLSIDTTPINICYLAATRFNVDSKKHEIKNPFLKGSEWRIAVNCSTNPRVVNLEAEAVVEFASCKENLDSIIRFARRYGPLLTEDASPEVKTLAEWVDMKYQFQDLWDDLIGLEHRKPAGSMFKNEYHALRAQRHEFLASLKKVTPTGGCDATGRFSVVEDSLCFVTKTLFAAMVVKLIQLAFRKRLRRCQNPECDLTPYFLLTRDRRNFCSADCANYGKRVSKLTWWNAQGRENRNNRTSKNSSTTK